MNLSALRKHWDAFGRTDPFWAVLTDDTKRGNRWSAEEFFRTGVAEIESVLGHVRTRGWPLGTRRALDFGCGLGRLTQALAVHFDEVVGVDIAPSMIERAREHNRHGERCRYVLNETDRLSMLADACFDFVYCSIVLQHMAPRYAKRYLAELVRVLAPGGLLAVQIPARKRVPGDERGSDTGVKGHVKAVLPLWLLRLYHRLRRLFEFPRMEGHGVRPEAVERTLEMAGARLLEVLPDESAGPAWESFRYFAVKGPVSRILP